MVAALAAPLTCREAPFPQLLHRVHIHLGGRVAARRPGPRTGPAASRSAARRGRRRSRARRARRRPGARGGRGSSRARSASRSGAGSGAGAIPTIFSQRSTTSASLSAVAMSKPLASMWHESRQTPIRLWPPARSISSRSSSNERPIVLPAPAVFSSSRRQRLRLAERVPQHLADPRRAPRRAARRPWSRGGAPRRRRRSRRPSAARGSARRRTFFAHLAVLGRRVDQVDGVDRHRLDRARSSSARGTRRRRPASSASAATCAATG